MDLNAILGIGIGQLVALVGGIIAIWSALRKDRREREQDQVTRDEKIRKQTETQVNMSRDIRDLKDDVSSINRILGNGSGLKNDIQKMRETCIDTRREFFDRLKQLEGK